MIHKHVAALRDAANYLVSHCADETVDFPALDGDDPKEQEILDAASAIAIAIGNRRVDSQSLGVLIHYIADMLE